jgi:predicted RNA-binding Zn ribbon-like protein
VRWAIDRSLPWLGGYPLAVDLANTVVRSGSYEVDLLTSEPELATWIEVERARNPVTIAARGHLQEVRALREAVRELLSATVTRAGLPPAALATVNDASARCPSFPTLAPGGDAISAELNDDPFDLFCGAVARSAIQVIAGPEREQLAVCHAPSCGMFFLRNSSRQSWCSPACGNRARVARHAARAPRRSPNQQSDHELEDRGAAGMS